MITFDFSECCSYVDILTAIEKGLKYEVVVHFPIELQEFFDVRGYKGDIQSSVICDRDISVYNYYEGGEEVYKVMVLAHFVDEHSNDYCYTWSVNAI